MKRLLCYESQHQSQSNEKSLVQFDYEKAVSNYLGTQSTFKGALQLLINRDGSIRFALESVSIESFVVLSIGNSESNHFGAQRIREGALCA